MTQTDISMFCQGDFPVSRSHSQANDSVLKTSDGSGLNTKESSTKLTPIGLLRKMLPTSPIYRNFPASMPTWKQKVTKSGFSIYAPQMSARPTFASGALSLPTPCTQFVIQKVRPLIPSEIAQEQGKKGHRTMLPGALSKPEIVAQLTLPTPCTSQDYKPVRPLIPSEKAGTHETMLCAALSNPDTVAKLLPLPTPCASDWKRQKAIPRETRKTPDLAWQALKLQTELEKAGFTKLPTPLASRLTEPVRELKLKEQLPHNEPGQPRYGKMLAGVIGTTYPSLIGRYIHPQFVEWMMAFPPEWTNPDCKLSAMQLCREWHTQYLKAYDEFTKETMTND